MGVTLRDGLGNTFVAPIYSSDPTYTFAPAVTGSPLQFQQPGLVVSKDFIVIPGVAFTGSVTAGRIKRANFVLAGGGTASATTPTYIALCKLSAYTATGGTASTTATITKSDPTDLTNQITPFTWTTQATTTGTLSSIVWAKALQINSATTPASGSLGSTVTGPDLNYSIVSADFDFCTSGEKPPTLRTAADIYSFVLFGTTVPSGSKLSYRVVYEEAAT